MTLFVFKYYAYFTIIMYAQYVIVFYPLGKSLGGLLRSRADQLIVLLSERFPCTYRAFHSSNNLCSEEYFLCSAVNV